MDVHPGKLTEVWFDAKNHGSEAIVGNAVPSVAPSTSSAFFNKTECFCFTEQVLKAGESRRMPVRFFVDTRLPKNVRELTLVVHFLRERRRHPTTFANRLAIACGGLNTQHPATAAPGMCRRGMRASA